MTTRIKNNCKDCNGKGWYSQMFGKHYAADFDFEGGDEAPKIHKIACSKCNFQNKRRLKDVIKSAWDS